MSNPTRDRTRRGGLALAAALLLALPTLAAPLAPASADQDRVEATVAGWLDGFADLWQHVLAAVGVPTSGQPTEPSEQPPDDSSLMLLDTSSEGELRPSLDPTGVY